MLSKIMHFLTTDIWRLRLKNYPRKKSFFIRQRVFDKALTVEFIDRFGPGQEEVLG